MKTYPHQDRYIVNRYCFGNTLLARKHETSFSTLHEAKMYAEMMRGFKRTEKISIFKIR